MNLYWDQLQGEKYALYVPNEGHSLQDFDRVLGSIIALHVQARGGRALPRLSWSFDDTQQQLSLTLQTDEKPTKVQSWISRSETRDFRNARWESSPIAANGEDYQVDLPTPATGYAAIFGEAIYGREAQSLYLSTNVRVIPKLYQAAGK